MVFEGDFTGDIPNEVWISPKAGAPLYGDFGANMMVLVEPRETGGTRDLRCGLALTGAPAVAAFAYAAQMDPCARP